jgi:hypothetical protein
VGTITASSFSGPLTGTINAGNVSSGAFASNTGGGNFSFPANVGIGTTGPGRALDVIGEGVFGTYTLSRGGYGNGINIQNSNGENTSLFLWQAGVGSGHIGFSSGDSDLRIVNSYSDGSLDNPAAIVLDNTGNVGIGTTNPQAKLHVAGNARISGTLSTQTGSDFAEEFVVSDYIEPGTVVVMGDLGYKSVKASSDAFDSSVVGVVSDNPSIIAGKVDSEKKAIVAMVGVVSVKVVDEGGEIKRGDLLTSSSVSGYARKADEYVGGTIIGKALEDLQGEKGMIKVLVNLQ